MKAISIICITTLLFLLYLAIFVAQDTFDEVYGKVPSRLVGSILAVIMTILYILALNEILCE